MPTAQNGIAARRGHPGCGPDGGRLGGFGEFRAERPARRGRRHPPPHPGHRGAAWRPGQPAGPGAAPGPHHDLRVRGAQLRQPVLPRGALRRRRGRGRGGATLLALHFRYRLERASGGTCRTWRSRSGWLGPAIAPVGTGESVRLWHDLRPGAPVVALNASAARITGVSRVRPDNAAAVGLPLRRLAELGHTSVAFLSAPRLWMADPDRLRYFRRLSRVLGLRATVVYSPLTMGDVQQATRAVLAGRMRRPRSSPTPTTPRMRSTRPRANSGCGSALGSPSSGTTTWPPPSSWIRRWRPSG